MTVMRRMACAMALGLVVATAAPTGKLELRTSLQEESARNWPGRVEQQVPLRLLAAIYRFPRVDVSYGLQGSNLMSGPRYQLRLWAGHDEVKQALARVLTAESGWRSIRQPYSDRLVRESRDLVIIVHHGEGLTWGKSVDPDFLPFIGPDALRVQTIELAKSGDRRRSVHLVMVVFKNIHPREFRP